MSGWHHRHVIDLAAFSRQDFATVLELAQRFRALPVAGAADASLTLYIPDGNYMSDDFETTMNNIFQNQGARLLILEIVQSRVVIRARNSGEGASAYDPAQTWYSPTFYFELDFV